MGHAEIIKYRRVYVGSVADMATLIWSASTRLPSGNLSGSATSQLMQRNLRPPVLTGMKCIGLLHLEHVGGCGFFGMVSFATRMVPVRWLPFENCAANVFACCRAASASGNGWPASSSKSVLAKKWK
jgi:hypothetical protein